MYTPDQASEMLKIPSSTLRRYAGKLFSSHLSEHATQQHKRKYTEQDIATLARARELLNQGKSPEQVNNLLSVVGDSDHPPESSLALIPSISQALTEALDTARALRVQVDAHEQLVSEHERKLAEMAEQLAKLEQAAQIPWYRKIFRRSA